jgi:uncharacterized membrane protein YdbT with pleckstrin-like domain
MSDPWVTPGQSAEETFRTGIRAALVAAVTVAGLLYWFGTISLLTAGFALLVLLPAYLIFVASLLSKWLGFDKDAMDLRPVVRTETPEEGREL